MTSLQEFIHLRMRELANKEQGFRHELEKIETERQQLRAAAQAAGLHFEPNTAPEGTKTGRTLDAISDEFAALLGRTRRTIPNKTIKDAVLEVLSVVGDMTALDILAAINSRFDTDYPRTSLSPQLSRLKAEGKITRVGNLWSLAPDGPETIEPGHPTSEETNDRAQYPEANSATVEPVEEVAHDNIGPKKVNNLFG